jgi:predicted 3-demethylubiquinone-9 3-methyltransferase (glyoxalase superfamily)
VIHKCSLRVPHSRFNDNLLRAHLGASRSRQSGEPILTCTLQAIHAINDDGPLRESQAPATFGSLHLKELATNLTEETSMTALQGFPRITPFLWFDSNAEEAVDFYLTVFKNSRRLDGLRSSTDTTVPKGKVLTITFELDGQKFTALNGGPVFTFTEAVSFFVRCDSQEEVDYYWSRLVAGGSENQCGWLKDKFGLSWQIVPAQLPELLKHPKAMQAMMKMKKLDIAELERAARS